VLGRALRMLRPCRAEGLDRPFVTSLRPILYMPRTRDACRLLLSAALGQARIGSPPECSSHRILHHTSGSAQPRRLVEPILEALWRPGAGGAPTSRLMEAPARRGRSGLEGPTAATGPARTGAFVIGTARAPLTNRRRRHDWFPKTPFGNTALHPPGRSIGLQHRLHAETHPPGVSRWGAASAFSLGDPLHPWTVE